MTPCLSPHLLRVSALIASSSRLDLPVDSTPSNHSYLTRLRIRLLHDIFDRHNHIAPDACSRCGFGVSPEYAESGFVQEVQRYVYLIRGSSSFHFQT